jgi:hypothetical protein
MKTLRRISAALCLYLIAAAAPRSEAQLLNLATRNLVETGDRASIHEFVIQGAGTRDILFRGIGPSLAAFGIQNPLANPLLELRDQSGALLTSNDNWMDFQQSEIEASGLAPSHPLEAALRTTLSSGMYSLEVRGVNSVTGVGLNELYDYGGIDTAVTAIGSRAFVSGGDNVLISGFIIGGSPTNVLVLALGPSLGSGVPKALSNPNVELRDQNGGVVATNDNWKSDQQQAIEESGLAPTDDRESGFIVELAAPFGAYTAIARGGGSVGFNQFGFPIEDSGIGWVQVYALPYTGAKLNPLPVVGSPNSTPSPTPPPPPPLGLSNLTFFQTPGWADKVLIANTTGTFTDSASFSTADTLYVDFSVFNGGQGSTFAPFTVALYVDDQQVATVAKPSLGALFFTLDQDVSIGSLTARTHTVRIKIDSTNNVFETNKSDNEYSKTVVVTAPGTPTPIGTDVSVDAGNIGSTQVAFTFPQVTSAGFTTIEAIDPATAGVIPGGYELAAAGLAYEVATTATYTGPVTVAFRVPSVDAVTFAQLRVLHNAGSGLVDVTAENPPADPVTQTIYASVSSFSPFVIAKRVYAGTVRPPLNADGTSVFPSKRGVIPIKFTVTLGGNPTCALPAATISVTRTAGATPGSINESVYAMAADNGSNFRVEGCEYIYNLNSDALGVGTYRAEIRINGGVAGSVLFQLK